jgi:TrmH RNA methyltransferase
MSKKVNQKFKKDQEVKIYGTNACLAVFNKRPNDIIQLFLTKEKLKTLSNITKFCASKKIAYHIVERSELDDMTKATHHEDVCMLVRKSLSQSLDQFLQTNPKKCLLIALENVSNPHNIGAIVRSAAHFGVTGLVVPDAKLAHTAAAVRTSEGGSEYVEIFEAADFKKTLLSLKKNGFTLITTSSHAKKSLYELEWPAKSVLIFGEEGPGLSKDTLSLGESIKIPGTDHVESLNVSVATAVILSDYYQKEKIHALANTRFK